MPATTASIAKTNQRTFDRLNKLREMVSKSNIKAISSVGSKMMGTHGYMVIRKMNLINQNKNGIWKWSGVAPSIEMAEKVREGTRKLENHYYQKSQSKKAGTITKPVATPVVAINQTANPDEIVKSMSALAGSANNLVHTAGKVLMAAEASGSTVKALQHDVQMLKAAMFDLQSNVSSKIDALMILAKSKPQPQ